MTVHSLLTNRLPFTNYRGCCYYPMYTIYCFLHRCYDSYLHSGGATTTTTDDDYATNADVDADAGANDDDALHPHLPHAPTVSSPTPSLQTLLHSSSQ